MFSIRGNSSFRVISVALPPEFGRPLPVLGSRARQREKMTKSSSFPLYLRLIRVLKSTIEIERCFTTPSITQRERAANNTRFAMAMLAHARWTLRLYVARPSTRCSRRPRPCFYLATTKHKPAARFTLQRTESDWRQLGNATSCKPLPTPAASAFVGNNS